MDLVAMVRAPEAPRNWLAWVMTILGGVVATCGAFLSIVAAMVYYQERALDHSRTISVGAMIGGIPLLIGLVLFVYGVKRIHAWRHKMPLRGGLVAATA